MVATAAYEECRRQRVEENKRRMQELKLLSLSSSLKKSIAPKPSPMKKTKPRVNKNGLSSMPVRRSSRVAEKPQPNYKEYAVDLFERSGRTYKRRDLLNRKYASDHERMEAIDRAERLDSGLDSESPTFVKPMLQSHVTGGFWLGLPVQFCKTYLPSHDEAITLVDEDGNEWETKYLAAKTGLSGGWRGFSLDHELVDGDALIFQLIKPTTFKVHIIRVNSLEDDEDDKHKDNGKVDEHAEKRSARTKSEDDEGKDNVRGDEHAEKRSSRTRSEDDKGKDNGKVDEHAGKRSSRTRSGKR